MNRLWWILLGVFVGIILYKIFVQFVLTKLISVHYNYLRQKAIRLASGKSIPLKECPFCGGNYQRIVEDYYEDGTPCYKMTCSEEEGGCGASTSWEELPFDAVILWNVRPNDYSSVVEEMENNG